MRYIKNVAIICVCLFAAAPAQAEYPAAKDFPMWVKEFKDQATAQGVSAATLDQAFQSISFNEKVIDLDQKQPDMVKRFDEYRRMVLPKRRIEKARALYAENKKLLQEIGKKYGVQPRFIVALWAIESNFGENTGGFSTVEALATLAYEGRRRDFFSQELINALKIIDEGNVSADNMKGSWAGAMGQCQFMPSSFLAYAVDYDGDGHRDIWSSKADVFASIANYLKQSGWSDEMTWGRAVHVPKDFDRSLISKDVTKTLADWKKEGVKTHANGTFPKGFDALSASLITPEDNGKDVFLIYPNYRVLLKWNRSLYFATTVGMLSDEIGTL